MESEILDGVERVERGEKLVDEALASQEIFECFKDL